MFIIIGIMLTGMLLGYLLRSKRLSYRLFLHYRYSLWSLSSYSIRLHRQQAQLLCPLRTHVLRRHQYRQRSEYFEEFSLPESAACIPSHHDDHWHISRLRRSRSLYEPTRSFRLYGSRSRIWILFTFQHFHYRIQGSRTGNYCVTFQYHA